MDFELFPGIFVSNDFLKSIDRVRFENALCVGESYILSVWNKQCERIEAGDDRYCNRGEAIKASRELRDRISQHLKSIDEDE